MNGQEGAEVRLWNADGSARVVTLAQVSGYSMSRNPGADSFAMEGRDLRMHDEPLQEPQPDPDLRPAQVWDAGCIALVVLYGLGLAVFGAGAQRIPVDAVGGWVVAVAGVGLGGLAGTLIARRVRERAARAAR